jgi:hypothetical protein
MLSIEANESMVYIGISNRGLEKMNGKKNSDYIEIWGGLRYPPKKAEMKRLCNQLP